MSTVRHPYRKQIRLPASAYLEPGTAWLVTIGVAERAPVFADHALAARVWGLIRGRCAAMGALLGAYCLMPDHAHLMVQITGAGLVDVIRDLKSRSTRLWWQHGGAGSLWQRSFYDRGLRTVQEWQDAVDYVIANPVRAGLVADWAEYPHLGGLTVEEASDDLLLEPESKRS